jgi:conjugative transfer pilus assembly protein TraH
MRFACRWLRRSRLRCSAGILVLVLLATTCLPSLASAGLESGIDNFLQDWEGQMTTSKPGFYEGQSRGYISGGSFEMRFPNRNPTPFALSMPKLTAGCGGISLMGGAFSFIDMDQFVKYLQSIAQNAMGMAFNMALTTLCPQCATVLAKLEQMAREVAGNLKNSCQMTKGLFAAAGLTPDKFRQTSYNNCIAINNDLGTVKDWWGGDAVCGSDPSAIPQAEQRETTRWRNAGSNPFDPPKTTSVNVFWSAYSRIEGDMPEYTTDFGEQLMAMFGTVVTNLLAAEGEKSATPFPARLDVLDLIDGYENKQGYSCDEYDLCLNPRVTLAPPYLGLTKTIRGQLVNYKSDLISRKKHPLSQYLTTDITGIPLTRLMVASQNVPGASDMVISFVSKYLAVQILRVYVRQLSDVIFAESQKVKNSGELETFNKLFEQRRDTLDKQFAETQRDLMNTLRVLQDLANITTANAGSSSSMFSRHTAFSGKLLRSASPMGH